MLFTSVPGYSDSASKMWSRSECKAQITYYQDVIRVLKERDIEPEWKAAKMRSSNAMLQYWQGMMARSVRAARAVC